MGLGFRTYIYVRNNERVKMVAILSAKNEYL